MINVRQPVEATPGQMYIKKSREEPEAETAKWLYSRSPVFELWKDWPGELWVLTLPGLEWKLEKKLLEYRHPRRLKTSFVGVEMDTAIYHSALPRRPPKASLHNMTVEAFINNSDSRWTAAWLDFNGPISTTKVAAMKRLWPRLSHSLVVTFLGARFDGQTRAMLKKAGDWGSMLADAIGAPRSHVAQSTYRNGKTHFVQLTVVKSGKLPDVSTCRYINGIKLEELISDNR